MSTSNPVNFNGGYFRSLESPIGLQYMKDPYIDPHGHTFDKDEIDQITRIPEDGSGAEFQCPMTDEWVKVIMLRPNLLAKGITEELNQGLEQRISLTIEQHVSYCAIQIEKKFLPIINQLQEKCGSLISLNTFLQEERDVYSHKLNENNLQLVEKEEIINQKETYIEGQRIELENQRTKIQEQEEKIAEYEYVKDLASNIQKVQEDSLLLGVLGGAAAAGLIFFNFFNK